MPVQWDDGAQRDFDNILKNLPQFHRSIAEKLVKEKAESLAEKRNSSLVEKKDLIVAFFQEVPPAFKDMMKRLMHQHGIDYSAYIDKD
ncbi:MAG: hypothetical protein GF375_05600 [Candidatus Omnitrophica bacterium]|nr:hypothetical protein [Candidatus Omnitrophota bacterium]MBD3269462.1 hypothetical protein [Candidatus Omnitrophota bacterium]